MPGVVDEEIKNLQLDKPGRGKSTEQLKKHTLQETFDNRPVERALYLLTKGDEIQKISIIQSLPQLLQIDEIATYTRILPKIQQELPSASCEFHINASKIFQLFMEKPKAPSNLLTSVLQGIESRDLLVVNAWLDTLIQVIPILREESIRNEILPIAYTKAALTQPVISRIACCAILGKIAIHPKFSPLDIKKDVLPSVQSLCQDVQPEVRAAICNQLPNVAQGLKTDLVKPHLLPCLVELAADSNHNVRSAAISAVVNVLPYTTPDIKKGTIFPLVKKLFESSLSAEDVAAGAVAKEIGNILKGLQGSLTPQDTAFFLNIFKTLARRGISTRSGDARVGDPSMDVICRDRCASSLPAIFKVTATVVPDQVEAMYAVFRDLATDPCYIVRRTVASCVHEIANILGPQNKMMKTEIVRLLRDDAEEVLQTLTPNIGTILSLLCKQGVLSKEKSDQVTMEIGRAMLKCQMELTKGYNFRLHTQFLSQLEQLPNCMPADFIHQHFTPVVLSNALSGRARPMRSQALRTLLVFLKYNNKENQQKWLRDTFITELCHSNSCYTRRYYIMLCGHAIDVFGANYFKDHFFQPLLNFANDPVSNVRLLFVGMLPQINKVLNPQTDGRLKQMLTEAVSKLESREKRPDILNMLKSKGKAPAPTAAPVDSGPRRDINMNMNMNIAPGSRRESVFSVDSVSSTSSAASPIRSQQRPVPQPQGRPPMPPPAMSQQSVTRPQQMGDMKFLEQHFLIDAGINMQNVEKASKKTTITKVPKFIRNINKTNGENASTTYEEPVHPHNENKKHLFGHREVIGSDHFPKDANLEPNPKNNVDLAQKTYIDTKAPMNTNDVCDEIDIGSLDLQLENDSLDLSVKVSVNLRNKARTPKKKIVDESQSSNSKVTNRWQINKRYSSVFSADCLENKATKKANNRHSLNLQARDISRIPLPSSKSSKDLAKLGQKINDNNCLRDAVSECDDKLNTTNDRVNMQLMMNFSANERVVNRDSAKNNTEESGKSDDDSSKDSSAKENNLSPKIISRIPQFSRSGSGLPLYVGRPPMPQTPSNAAPRKK